LREKLGTQKLKAAYSFLDIIEGLGSVLKNLTLFVAFAGDEENIARL
jgi:hypothetical protein